MYTFAEEEDDLKPRRKLKRKLKQTVLGGNVDKKLAVQTSPLPSPCKKRGGQGKVKINQASILDTASNVPNITNFQGKYKMIMPHKLY